MTPYITFKDEIENGLVGYFVLQREYPHYVGIISEQPVFKFVHPVPVSSYKLWITFFGSLRGNYIPSYNNVDKEIASIMQSMASWFFDNRILVEPKKYKKWKIQ